MSRNLLIAIHGILEREEDMMIGWIDIPFIVFIILVIAAAVYGFIS